MSTLADFEEFAVYNCRQRPKPADKRLYQRQIDVLVYELHGLTKEEIAIVEGG
jgi:hypothetical protein